MRTAVGNSLVLWSTSDRKGGYAGGVFRYDGGSIRVRIRFTPGRPGWATATGLGIQMIGADPALFFAWDSSGAGDRPTTQFYAWHRAVGGHHTQAAFPKVKLYPDETYVVELEYVPGLERVYVELRDGRGERIAGPVSWDLDAPLDRGTYAIGWAKHQG